MTPRQRRRRAAMWNRMAWAAGIVGIVAEGVAIWLLWPIVSASLARVFG